MIEFTIPGRPAAWQRTNAFLDKRTGRLMKATPKTMIAAQKAVATLCRYAMRTKLPLKGPLKLEVLCVYAIPRSWPAWKQEAAHRGEVWKTSVPDFDNLVKLIADALNEVAYHDDSQIVAASFGKRYGSPERTDVRIAPLDVLCDHSARGAFSDANAQAMGQASLLPAPVKASNTQSGRRAGRGGLA